LISIKVELNKKDLAYVQEEFNKIKNAINPKDLNEHRAKRFKTYTKANLSSGAIRLLPLSQITILLAGAHNPEFLTGKLLDEMKVVSNADKSATAGYWNPSKKVPGKNLTFADLAIIQHTGYRIPISGGPGTKGFKVRAWLAKQNVPLGTINKKTTFKGVIGSDKWIIVPPRPFVPRSLKRYLEEDMDSKAVHEYIDRVLK
jgi:hypothetical protein